MAIVSAIRSLNPARLTGPIFSKELRVSSRRRRLYVLRFLYVALLGLFVLVTWHGTVGGGAGGADQVYLMSKAGKAVVAAVAWFQFIVLQLIAVVAASTAISDEIYHGTIGTLLTTPITSFQIVVGKLASKMLQILLLLALGLPILAVVRVFGGVPWDFVAASACITLTAALTAGAVSLFFSIFCKRAYTTILAALGTGFFAYIVAAYAIILLSLATMGFRSSPDRFFAYLGYANPFWALQNLTMSLLEPRFSGFVTFWWPGHCLVMLAASLVVVLLSAPLVRRAALRSALGGPPGRSRRPAAGLPLAGPLPPPLPAAIGAALLPPAPPGAAPGRPMAPPVTVGDEQDSGIRHVTGPPVIWKELRVAPSRRRVLKIVLNCIAVLCLLIAYLLLGHYDALDEDFTHRMFAVMFVLTATVGVAVVSATTISTEKESRTLAALLTTELTDREIILGKAVGVFRRCLPKWIWLMAHALIFTFLGYLRPLVLLHLGLLALWITAFLTGTGLYFSSRFKKTTAAVVANLGLGLFLWAVLPLVMALGGSGESTRPTHWLVNANPLYEAGLLAGDGSSSHRFRYAGMDKPQDLGYRWLDHYRSAAGTTSLMFEFLLGYSAAGLFFLWRAKCNLRRNVF